jgi:hypothetical protein
MPQATAALFEKLTLIMATKREEIERSFKEIVQGCQVFGNDIWNIICGIRNDLEGESNALAE